VCEYAAEDGYEAVLNWALANVCPEDGSDEGGSDEDSSDDDGSSEDG
jgi:hypothetical protein